MLAAVREVIQENLVWSFPQELEVNLVVRTLSSVRRAREREEGRHGAGCTGRAHAHFVRAVAVELLRLKLGTGIRPVGAGLVDQRKNYRWLHAHIRVDPRAVLMRAQPCEMYQRLLSSVVKRSTKDPPVF
jgi:hypothetical protein